MSDKPLQLSDRIDKYVLLEKDAQVAFALVWTAVHYKRPGGVVPAKIATHRAYAQQIYCEGHLRPIDHSNFLRKARVKALLKYILARRRTDHKRLSTYNQAKDATWAPVLTEAQLVAVDPIKHVTRTRHAEHDQACALPAGSPAKGCDEIGYRV